ncbi:DUF1289 domain-containing protein [Aestuariibacter salexigens]|uniref:DUF1289 domain-containing protein n=1 Tax=Aestuariibacter salexigens TaxID=226010 RepID=UPI001F0B37E5|nr:DUF1289 domain-containing protein [Aestuariibacter salexigens]
MKLSSPCVRRCTLDSNDQCLGCYRTLDEILNWTSMGEEKRQQLVLICAKRKVQYEQLHADKRR